MLVGRDLTEVIQEVIRPLKAKHAMEVIKEEVVTTAELLIMPGYPKWETNQSHIRR
jgi:hypothetical protein